MPVPSIEPGQEKTGWTEEHHLMMRSMLMVLRMFRMFRMSRISRMLMMPMTRIVMLVVAKMVKLMSGIVMMKMKNERRIEFGFSTPNIFVKKSDWMCLN